MGLKSRIIATLTNRRGSSSRKQASNTSWEKIGSCVFGGPPRPGNGTEREGERRGMITGRLNTKRGGGNADTGRWESDDDDDGV